MSQREIRVLLDRLEAIVKALIERWALEDATAALRDAGASAPPLTAQTAPPQSALDSERKRARARTVFEHEGLMWHLQPLEGGAIRISCPSIHTSTSMDLSTQWVDKDMLLPKAVFERGQETLIWLANLGSGQ